MAQKPASTCKELLLFSTSSFAAKQHTQNIQALQSVVQHVVEDLTAVRSDNERLKEELANAKTAAAAAATESQQQLAAIEQQRQQACNAADATALRWQQLQQQLSQLLEGVTGAMTAARLQKGDGSDGDQQQGEWAGQGFSVYV